MLITIKGLVIGRRVVGEANCYLDILTGEYGVIEVLAHGVKSFKSKTSGSVSLFSYSVFCLNKKGLRYTINSVSPKYNFYRLSHDINTLALASYFAEVIKYTSASEQHDENILRLLLIAFYELEHNNLHILLIKAIFEFKISALLGFSPDLRACENCACYLHDEMFFLPESGSIFCADCYSDREYNAFNSFLANKTLIYLMRFIIYSPLNKIFRIKTDAHLIKELSLISEKYLLLHLDRSFKTLDYFYNYYIGG